MTVSQVADDDSAAFSLFPADLGGSSSPVSRDRQQGNDQEVEDEFYGRKSLKRSDNSVRSSDSRTTNNNSPINNGTVQERNVRVRNHPQSQSSSNEDTQRQRNPPNSVYENWSCDGDDINGSRTNTNKNTNNETADDLAWKIISVVLKGWCCIWILFAILVISAEVFSPGSSTSKKNASSLNAKTIVTLKENAGQTFLEISENIVSSCSYSNLDTEDGREECQSLCHNHMCCFINDDDTDATFQSHRYGCVNDPEKMCAAYAGCEALIVSEDDAIIYNADGVDVFAEDDDTAVSGSTPTPSNDEQSQSSKSKDATTSDGGASSTPTASISQLQLIGHVVTSVCANDNLHSRHGILECASLCSMSMCCFNRTEIEELNPKMDLILKMEGVSNDVLDRSAMGTCINEEEEEEGDDVHVEKLQSHFCQVHAGCKNILLLGAPTPVTTKKRKPSSNDTSLIFTNVGVYGTDHNIHSNSSSVTSDQERMLSTVLIMFGMVIGLSVYLLVCTKRRRFDPLVAIDKVNSRMGGSTISNSNDDDGRTKESEMVDFV